MKRQQALLLPALVLLLLLLLFLALVAVVLVMLLFMIHIGSRLSRKYGRPPSGNINCPVKDAADRNIGPPHVA
jgi:hypothetical protein